MPKDVTGMQRNSNSTDTCLGAGLVKGTRHITQMCLLMSPLDTRGKVCYLEHKRKFHIQKKCMTKKRFHLGNNMPSAQAL
jgi:hypothetical protein